MVEYSGVMKHLLPILFLVFSVGIKADETYCYDLERLHALVTFGSCRGIEEEKINEEFEKLKTCKFEVRCAPSRLAVSQPKKVLDKASKNEKHLDGLLATNKCLGCDLRNVDLSGMDLSDANLRGSDLSCALLAGADLGGSNLSRSNLSSVDLKEADLEGANLSGVVLCQTRMPDGSLHNTDCGPDIETTEQRPSSGGLIETLESWRGKYVGQVKNGQPHGQGSHIHPDGSKYVGQYKDGAYHGRGTYFNINGNKHVGEYKDGLPHGQGTETFANGHKYVGGFKESKWHGQGTYTWPNGEKYVGEWKEGMAWTGRKYFPDGSDLACYAEGEFFARATCKISRKYKGVNGKQNIVQRCKTGTYIGESLDGHRHGQGTFTLNNGDKYVGEWKEGLSDGQGTYFYVDGGKYVGEWKENNRHGQGTATPGDGTKYVGEWKNGKEHGEGMVTWADGSKYVGEFKDGRPWTGTAYDKAGNAILTFSDGVSQ